MAYAATNTTGGIAGRLSALSAAITERLARHRVYNQTFRELSQLSGRDLADLGIHRSQIKRIAYEAAYK